MVVLPVIMMLLSVSPASVASLDTVAQQLDGVEIVQRKKSMGKLKGATDTQLISASELLRAACCNLGESFTTNPSVDVSYDDAATGARQIKLLGLSGAYVQTLTENTPSMRGLALPYGLSYTPGPWIQSISVSKGAASVKNGREAITGQVDVELKKPQAGNSVEGNAYFDSELKGELNGLFSRSLTRSLSTSMLVHGEHSFMGHDSNHDGFIDMPRMDQVSVMNRWAWLGGKVAVQGAVKYLGERRRSGSDTHHGGMSEHPYRVELRTQRVEGWAKCAYIFDKENDGNVAFIFSGNRTGRRDLYGIKRYRADQTELHAVGMLERKWNGFHALSTGVSFDRDELTDILSYGTDNGKYRENESVAGVYVQYTWTPSSKVTLMGGVRYDYSWLYRNMITPRFHVRYNPTTAVSLHAAAGRGLRTAHVLAEYSYLLGSPRQLVFNNPSALEDAWNVGGGADFTLYPFGRSLTISVEYYYTGFRRQLVADLYADGTQAIFHESRRASRSHTGQIEATWMPFSDFTFTAAYRLTDAKTDYDGAGLVQRPFTPLHKALFTAGYAPMMGLWMFDVTCTLTGSGRFPRSLSTTQSRYPAFAQLNAQVTRTWRHCSVYIGGENLTGYKQPHPILGTDDPYNLYDATMIYGPLHGVMVYAGVRVNF